MHIRIRKPNATGPRGQSGFTLVELLIAMLVAVVIASATALAFQSFEENSNRQVEVANLQLNVRGAIAVMEREFRMIGMDFMTGNASRFRVLDIRRFSITEPGTSAVPDANGSPILRMSLDLNDDGILDVDETITYSLYDRNGNGVLFDLARSETLPGANLISGRQLLAEGIEAIAFSYAYDERGDGNIDRLPPAAGSPQANGNIIWARDANNDGNLDIQANGDPLPYGVTTVPPTAIAAIQVTVLARVKHRDLKFRNTQTYSVGNQVINANDNFRRWMLTEILHRRNP